MLKFGKICTLFGVLLLAACFSKYDYTVKDEVFLPNIQPEAQAVAEREVRTLSGLKYCPNTRQCSDDALLPPQPCVQPMPTYYGDVSVLETDMGIVLIHPVTRDEVICYEQDNAEAQACAERFLAEGYVLITDVPQFAGRYDILQDGSYPARKWRKGETIPRW